MNIVERIKEEYESAKNDKKKYESLDEQVNELKVRINELINAGNTGSAMSYWREGQELLGGVCAYWLTGCDLLIEGKRPKEAEKAAWWAIYLSRDNPLDQSIARIKMAEVCQLLGKQRLASINLEIATRKGDPTGSAHYALAKTSTDLSNNERIELLAKAIALNSENRNALAAIASYIKVNGSYAEEEAKNIIYNYLGCSTEYMCTIARLEFELGRYEIALSKAAKLVYEGYSETKTNNLIAACLIAQYKYPQAIEHYSKAYRYNTGSEEYLLKVGLAYFLMGDPKKAESLFRTARKIADDKTKSTQNLAMCLLIQGKYAEGWKAYESRFWSPQGRMYLNKPGFKRVTEKSEIKKGMHLLLTNDQSLGDWLQFSRYAIMLAKRGVEIELEVNQKLWRIAKTSMSKHKSIKLRMEGEDTDAELWSPLCSIPKVLMSMPYSIPLRGKYLEIELGIYNKWKEVVDNGAAGRFKLGLHWQGDPTHEETLESMGRSINLESLRRLAGIEGTCLVSLQRFNGSEQIEQCSFRDRFIPTTTELEKAVDFEDVGAIAESCDIVITNDTAMAHLAGGLGIKTLLLLKRVPEWRWGLNGQATPWYESISIVREEEFGSWDKSIEKSKHIVEKHVKTTKNRTRLG